MMEELQGSEGFIVYHIHHHGGSLDGYVFSHYKPYIELYYDETNEMYRIDSIDHDHLIYESDFNYKIDIYLDKTYERNNKTSNSDAG